MTNKGICLRVHTSITTHILQALPFPWQGGSQCYLQLYSSNLDSVHQVPITAGWKEVVSYTSTRDRHYELNPRPSEFNALSTWPHASPKLPWFAGFRGSIPIIHGKPLWLQHWLKTYKTTALSWKSLK